MSAKLKKVEGPKINWQENKKLNLGCGKFPKHGFVNVDIDTKSGADFFCDLAKFPYDLPSKHFELIESDHLLEHLPNPYDFMKEMDRLLAPGGRLILRVPHYTRALTHWDHKRGFDVTFPFYFNPNFKGGYTGIHLNCSHQRLRWYSQAYLKESVLPAWQQILGELGGVVFDYFANLSPFFCSRVWGFWVGGFEEVEFHFEKPANLAKVLSPEFKDPFQQSDL